MQQILWRPEFNRDVLLSLDRPFVQESGLVTDRCAVIFDFYFADTNPSAEAHNKESIAVSERVQEEDAG